ncbi:cell-envelope stress modulator CpxP [Enterobacter sp. R1(2018)]|uniref:cell-envelope stress modulator CpxP n=1 Tax=Enterobacter sp. R1(2018) TaxID=2447891 RepID=UPI000EB1A42B|nr:cell-envelope stress modulator CpxP [Enterobacter sp. R1(2018)]RKQ40508.1 cell-envelope stress modulator CpxP [Enterobacter sp. R1(2018)]
MRNVTAAVMASTLVFATPASQATDLSNSDNWQHGEELVKRTSVQNQMFDGINLTEQQRQQMRDLMQRARHDSPPVNVREMEAMHKLVTAENFDETAVRIQAEKMAQEQVARQVEMAKVRNQMYNLLTPEQQAVLNDKHQQRMNQFRELSDLQRTSSLQAMSSSNTRSNQ